MINQIKILVALYASSCLISIGHAASAALIIQQGSGIYRFSDFFLGILVSVTYVGFIAGNYLSRYLLPRISYIRTFSVCAALMSVWILFLPIFAAEAYWLLLRFLHGLFFSTTVILCEGWLNSTATNENRSRLHSILMTVNYIAFGVSQYILLLGDRLAGAVFSLVAVFVIASLVPICMTRFGEPQASAEQKEGEAPFSLIDAYRIAPMVFIGQFIVGIMTGATWLFVRYAQDVAESVTLASQLAALYFAAGFVLQYPIGWLSDRIKDRRLLMIGVYGVTTLCGGVLVFGELLPFGILLTFVFLHGSIYATAFSLNVVYGNNFVDSSHTADYSGRLFQSFAVGALAGPAVAGFLMDQFSSVWLFVLLVGCSAGMTVVALTARFMSRHIPANPEPFQMRSSQTPTIIEEQQVYNEYEIGPQLPPDAAAEVAEVSEDVIGPVVPDDEEIVKEVVGPVMPDPAVAATGDLSSKSNAN